MTDNLKASSIVYLDSVSKIYPTAKGEFYAIRQVSIDVQPGEFYSLLGSSGSGKTTTLRTIGGFEIPEYGQVYIGGEDVTSLPPYRRNVHTVFQNYALFPHLTVTQNIAYPLTIARVPRSEIAPRVEESLRMFRIEGLGDRKPAQLSGGQQQRVALARALISRPKVLLLDEPLSALDAKIREEVRQELRTLQKQINLTFIYVTHDQEEALALSDRIAVMHNGQVEQIGNPKEIYNRPASPFVAQFIGKANCLTGKVRSMEGAWVWVEVEGGMVKAIAPTYQPTVGETVMLMIRPEYLRLESAMVEHRPTNPDENRISAKIETTTYIGQQSEIHLSSPIGQLNVTQLGSKIEDATALTVSWITEDCVIIPPAQTPISQ